MNLQELCCGGLVQDPSVRRQLGCDRGDHPRLAAPFKRRQHLAHARPHSQDARLRVRKEIESYSCGIVISADLRRVDDCREGGDAEHAQVGNGEGAALVLLWLQLAFPGSTSQVLHSLADVRQSAFVCLRHDGRDQSIRSGDLTS